MTRSKIYNLSKEELQELLDKSSTYMEILRYVGIESSSSTVTLKRIIKEYDLDTTKFELNKKEYLKQVGQVGNNTYDIQNKLKKGTNVNSHKLKNKLIELGLKEEKCEMCGITEWLGQPVKFHLHHEDGDHFNNELSNLKILCPNCHSLTDNYGVYNSDRYKGNKVKHYCKICGKELKKKRKTGLCKECYTKNKPKKEKNQEKYEHKKDLCPICKIRYKRTDSNMCIICYRKKLEKDITQTITRDKLKKLIREKTFVDISNLYNVIPKTVREWCKKYNLPHKKSDINKYTDDEWENI